MIAVEFILCVKMMMRNADMNTRKMYEVLGRLKHKTNPQQ